MNHDVKVLNTTVSEDGTCLVAHLGVPRFCVGATSAKDAYDKAVRAVRYFESVKDSLVKQQPKEVRVITPVYQSTELCA